MQKHLKLLRRPRRRKLLSQQKLLKHQSLRKCCKAAHRQFRPSLQHRACRWFPAYQPFLLSPPYPRFLAFLPCLLSLRCLQ